MMPLHIFEPRYRQMMAHCLEGDKRFGLIYHDAERDGPFEINLGRVGCVAEILKFQPLPDGRSLVLTQGDGRFQIEDGIESEALYHEALVDEYPDIWEDPAHIVERRRRSIELFHRVLHRMMGREQALPPVDAERETSFQLAQTIRVDPNWQQELLETQDERRRLDLVDHLLTRVLETEDK